MQHSSDNALSPARPSGPLPPHSAVARGHDGGALPLWTAGLAGAALAVYGLGTATQSLLQYERAALLDGALWRLLTQHWTHWSPDHLAWDVAVFAALGAVCELRDRRRFLLGVGLAAPLISLGLLLAAPSLATCRGLSGIDSALFAVVAADWAGRGGHWRALGLLAMVLFLGKCVVESVTGMTLFVNATAASMVPVPLAHLIGFLCGLLAAWLPQASPGKALAPMRSGPGSGAVGGALRCGESGLAE
jgi:rhomboid family GlyGly-CTERM serine protease